MPAAAVQAVYVLCVQKVSPADGPGQRLFARGHPDQVHVVGHQAIAEQPHAPPCGLLPEDPQINAAVVIDEEDVLAVVAALGDVVRHPRNNDSGGPWHDPTLTPPACRVNAQGTPKAPAGVSAVPAGK